MRKYFRRGLKGYIGEPRDVDYYSAKMGNELLPLSFLNVGEEGTVVSINAGARFMSRILGMGIHPGVKVRVLSKGYGGIVVQVNNTRYAFGFGMGMKIIIRRDSYG